MLRLGLLGPPVIEVDDRPVRFDTRKAVAVLALLAVEGTEQSRERLAGLLWPDSDETRARSALRRTLSVTAAEVGKSLVVSRGAVALDPETTSIDVAAFDALMDADDAASIARGVRLYRGDFLSGFVLRGSPEFDDWQTFVADGLRQRLSGGLARLVRVRVAAGELDAATIAARRWLALDPLHEPAHQSLMRLLSWTGQRSAAMQQYRQCVAVLDRELGVRPLPATTSLYDAVRTDRLGRPPAPTPAVRRASRRPAPAPRRLPPDLVGREGELAVLTEAWRSVDNVGRATTVVGEAGAGKTRLVEAFLERLDEAGAPVLATRCHDGESGLAFGAVSDLVRAAESARTDLSQQLEPADLVEVSKLVPMGHGRRGTRTAGGPGALARLYRAVGAALVAAAGANRGVPGPAGVVVVEDAQWIDEASADLLAYLLRRPEQFPVLVLTTWRPGTEHTMTTLRDAYSAAERDGAAVTVQLEPLTEAAVADLLVRAEVHDVDAGWLTRETRGLPLLVTSYVEALRAGDAVARDRAPARVRALLLARLEPADETTQQVLTAAAVLGGEVDVDLLRTTSGRSPEETVNAIDDALRRGLLVETGGKEDIASYDFPYAVLREVVYDRASRARVRLLHGRAADAMIRRADRESAPAISRQLRAAGRNEEAAHWSWRAGQRADRLGAREEALTHFQEAFALGYPAAAAHMAIGSVYTSLGRYPEALGEYEQAAAALAVAGPEPSARTHRADRADDTALAVVEHRLAEVHHRLGDWAAAETHLHAALRLLDAAEYGTPRTRRDRPGDQGDVSLRARVQADRALVAYRRGDAPAAHRLADEAQQLARGLADRAALAQALDVAGMLAAAEGDSDAAEASLRESLALARDGEDLGQVVAALNNLARLLADTGRLDVALDAAEEALRLGRQYGDRHRVAALHTNLADLLHAAARGDEAIGQLKQAAALFAAVDATEQRRAEIWTLVEW
ncbi:MAG TPA: AAA family ATPase [Nocardioidaceae bacterium]|nr:AAA family ATPase [Nocardioidaceae bacterium]